LVAVDSSNGNCDGAVLLPPPSSILPVFAAPAEPSTELELPPPPPLLPPLQWLGFLLEMLQLLPSLLLGDGNG
jgi:hypothetical protein